MTAYFLVNRVPQPPTSVGLPAYRGVDRSPWDCVDALYYAGKLSPELVAKRRASFERHDGNLSFGTVASAQEARYLAAACNVASPAVSILAVRPIGTLDELGGDSVRSSSLGFDAYVDGYGSLIALGIVQIAESFPEIRSSLTKAGLFRSLEDVRAYWRRYLEVSENLDLEPLAGAGPVWIYELVEEIPL
jgi:hypothetical protein